MPLRVTADDGVTMLQEPNTPLRQRFSFNIEEGMERPTVPLLGPEIEEAVEAYDEKPYDEKPFTVIGRSQRDRTTLAALWALSLVLTAICTWVLARSVGSPPMQSFNAGYDTELRDARSAIRLQTTQFTGGPDFKSRHMFIHPDSPSLAYIGSTPWVDEAWDELTLDNRRYFLLSDAEAQEAYGPGDISKYWNNHHGGWAAGLDVLHTLHCLNHLRKTLYPQVYPQDPQNAVHHSQHCIDHLRQVTMCHGDLTPIPTQYFPGLSQNYINSSTLHTCRNFDSIRDWATERFNGSTAVKARNRDGTIREEFYGPWGGLDVP